MTNSASEIVVQRRSAVQVIKQMPHTLIVAVMTAIAGILFGIEINYWSPVTGMNSFREDLNDGHAWGPSKSSLMCATFFLGCMLSTFPVLISFNSEYLGRRLSLLIGAVFYTVGFTIQMVTPSQALLVVGRACAGIGMGMISFNAPVYASEISPPECRGLLGTLYQFGICVGQLLGSIDGAVFSSVAHGWRYVMIVAIVMGVAYIIYMFFMPESPRFLVKKNKTDAAMNVLIKFRKGADGTDIQSEYSDILSEDEADKRIGEAQWKEMFRGSIFPVLLVGVFGQLIQQFTGMNMIMYYATTIYQSIGLAHLAFTLNVINALLQTIASAVLVLTVDKMGRRFYLLWGSLIMGLCMTFIAIYGDVRTRWPTSCDPSIMGDDPNRCSHSVDLEPGNWHAADGYCIVIAIWLFQLAFQLSWGPIIWMFCSEIFPARYRSKGVACSTFMNWTGNFIVVYTGPFLQYYLNFNQYFVYAFFNLIPGIFFAWWIPETKGVKMEDLTELWESKLGVQLVQTDMSKPEEL